MRRAAVLLLCGLTACGPIPVEQAEAQCFQRARLATQPRGEVFVGLGTGGYARGGVDITISSDYLAGRDPSALYDVCVQQRSGQPPSRPLYARPDWKG